jgi:hypothetical protein
LKAYWQARRCQAAGAYEQLHPIALPPERH